MDKIVYKELSYRITGLCFRVQKELGRFCRERQYADRLEELLKEEKVTYQREFEIRKLNSNSPKGNRVDFFIENQLLLDAKAKPFITNEDYAQMQRYLRGANLKLGLIVNFKDTYLKPKRVLNSHHSQTHSHFSHRAGGFTVIETLVAIAVLLLAITAPLTLAEKSLASVAAAREEITAFFLAQEAMEYIKNKRDENAITGRGGGPAWLKDLDDCVSVKGCGIDSTASPGKQVVPCDADDDCSLWQHTGDPPRASMKGIFGHPTNRGGGTDDWKQSLFKRKVFITEIDDDKEATIKVELAWSTKGLGARKVEVQSNLLNWYAL